MDSSIYDEQVQCSPSPIVNIMIPGIGVPVKAPVQIST